MKVTIYWNTKNADAIHRIWKRYGIVRGMTVNGENTIEVDETQYNELREVERLGYIQLRNK